MALNKTTVVSGMSDALESEVGAGLNSQQIDAIGRVAGKLADAIDVFVKSGTFTINSGIPISLVKASFPPATYVGTTTASANCTVT